MCLPFYNVRKATPSDGALVFIWNAVEHIQLRNLGQFFFLFCFVLSYCFVSLLSNMIVSVVAFI